MKELLWLFSGAFSTAYLLTLMDQSTFSFLKMLIVSLGGCSVAYGFREVYERLKN